MSDPNALSIEEVLRLAREQYQLEHDVAALERDLKTKQQLLRDLSERVLPDAMDVAEVTSLTLANGWTLTVQPQVHSAIAAAKREEAFAWLRAHGHEALIKRELVLSFQRGTDHHLESFQQALHVAAKALGLDEVMGIEDKATVHPSTLKAFVREQLAEGSDLPFETFGVFHRRVAILQSPTSSKE